jgi:chemotaxis protein methyltransferase CheR
MSLAVPNSLARRQAPLSDAEFRTLRDLVYQRSGLHFREDKKPFLENRVHKRLKVLRLASPAEYVALLGSPAGGPAELLEFLDIAATHETSFFRNQPQLDAFRQIVLPRLLERGRTSGSPTLRIWSAACSSGEEPYTLAMLVLEELGAEAPRWEIRILGTDVAPSVLRKAEIGVYHQYSFRSTPEYFLGKYFDADGPDTYRLKDGPRRAVAFEALNFADDERMGAIGTFQVIFCRNALIYFDREAKRRFVHHFWKALEEGGYLFLGHSESLRGVTDVFNHIHFPCASAYWKTQADAERRSSPWNRTA